MPVDENSSLKERSEQTIANLLSSNPKLHPLIPRKENVEDKPTRPFIDIVASQSREISPGVGVFRIPVAINLNFNGKQPGQSSDDMDATAEAVHDQISLAQTDGTYGLIRENDANAFEGTTGRKRTILLTLIAG